MIELDTKDLLCPLPVLKLRKALSRLASGDVVRMEATDPAALIDVPFFCSEQGHELIAQDEAQDVLIFQVRKG